MTGADPVEREVTVLVRAIEVLLAAHSFFARELGRGAYPRINPDSGRCREN